MQHLILREGAWPTQHHMSAEVAQALRSTGAVDVQRTDTPDLWLVAPALKVGVIRAGDLQVTLRPKVPIARLVFLMGYADNPDFWQDSEVDLAPETELPEALATTFVQLATRATKRGLLKGYETRDDTLHTLRGRIREADQVKRRWGRAIPLEVRYDDLTVDIAENRILLAVTIKLLRLPGISQRNRTSLQRLRVALGDVTPLPAGQSLPAWRPSRLNAPYQPALRIAGLVWKAESFEQQQGDLTVSAFLFNLATIFENFVTKALQQALSPFGGRSVLQFPGHLDEEHRVNIRPDFVWLDGEPQIVADAKYKAEKPAGFPQADLYQMLAYCTVLGLDHGHLIYARGNEPESRYTVVGSGCAILAHTLDLGMAPAELLSLMDELARCMIEAAAPRMSR